MPLSRLIALIINARSAAESLIKKDQIMRDKPNSSAVGAACLAATPGEASGVSLLHDVKIRNRQVRVRTCENVFSNSLRNSDAMLVEPDGIEPTTSSLQS
jgi:hypothetical protein